MNRRKAVSIMAGVLALILILTLLLSILPASIFAASSSTLKQELEALKDEAAEIKQQRADLKKEQEANASDTLNVVEQKKEIDQQIKLIHDEIDNINAQIQAYNLMIAEKQKELDDAKTRQANLSEQYSTRIRAMEKNSHISYWSVLFQSTSFSDFLGNLQMMADIAQADQKMLAELEAVALEIQSAQAELADEKAGLDSQRAALAESQAELDEKSAEANRLLDQLNDDAERMRELQAEYEAKESEISSDIAAKEKEYTEALKKEEEAQKNNGSSGSGSSGGGGGGGSWGYPLPYRATVTSAYGWRTHPITGKQSFHNGVDLAAGSGTAIYAVRSGTVTTATYSSVYGYYVTVNHGDGYSSLYAHMTDYVVSNGQYVEKGQLLGYVGSTGWSTGPHLHFTIYYNGSTVNPMDYI